MKRILGAFVGALLLSALPAVAQGEKPKADAAKPSSSKTMTANGTVSAVAADSLTVKAKEGELTFAVDKDTSVSARGASHKTAAMKDDKKTTQITDFVKVGDTVTVKYHDMGDKKHAASVSVRGSAAPSK